MVSLADWLPPACVGATFTLVGLFKVYGLAKGIQGEGCKPYGQRLCGSCPSWSREFNIGMTVLYLVIGLGNLLILVWNLSSGGKT